MRGFLLTFLISHLFNNSKYIKKSQNDAQSSLDTATSKS